MAKRHQSEESAAVADQPETTPPPPTNGDAAPAKKPPRDKAAAFKKVGNQRVLKAIYAMRRLLPLANKNAYTYTPEQAKTMQNVAIGLADEVVKAFGTTDTKEEPPASFF